MNDQHTHPPHVSIADAMAPLIRTPEQFAAMQAEAGRLHLESIEHTRQANQKLSRLREIEREYAACKNAESELVKIRASQGGN